MRYSRNRRRSELFTTSEAAEFCAVDRRTMLRWVSAGTVKSHRTAGGRHRIHRRDLVEFMGKQGMPIPEMLIGGARSVAIVDDDPGMIRGLRRLIKRVDLDADIHTASSGFEAGALITSLRPGVVFIDLVMPGIDGLQVCKYIRDESLDCTVVVVSGNLTDGLREELKAAGADHVVAKPFDSSEMRELVREILGERRMRAAR